MRLLVCVCVCRSETATLNIAVNRSLPLPSSLHPSASTTHVVAFFSGFKLMLLVTLVALCCVLSTLFIAACILVRRRTRRAAAASRDPEVTSHDKMAPLCTNGKVAVIHTSTDDKRENNGHVMLTSFYIFHAVTCIRTGSYKQSINKTNM